MTYLSFPRQHARTQRFTLGAPRSFAVAPGGERVAFLRSRSGTDTAQLLWVLDLPAGEGEPGERVAADPAELLGGSQEDVPAAEAEFVHDPVERRLLAAFRACDAQTRRMLLRLAEAPLPEGRRSA